MACRQRGETWWGSGITKWPLWYSSVKKEHLVVLTNAGMFDTSHMAVVMAKGADAFDLIQLLFYP